MDWNKITKQIKMFLAEHPNAPFNIEIISFDNQKDKVIMKKYLQPEDLEVDGIGLEHKKTFILYN